MKGIDSHCHLDFEQFDDDREEVISRSREDLKRVVTPGANPEHNKNVFNLHKQFPEFIEFNTGLHPVYTDDFDSLSEVKSQIRNYGPCAVGEIGLDHHHVKDDGMRNRQQQVFEELLDCAEKAGKTVVLHTRDAESKVLDILDSYNLEGVFLHCFNGSESDCRRALDNEYFVGVTTQVLYSSHVQKLVSVLKLDNIFLETDSPYLYRGSRNEPLNILESAEKIADIKEVDKNQVLNATSDNALSFFGTK